MNQTIDNLTQIGLVLQTERSVSQTQGSVSQTERSVSQTKLSVSQTERSVFRRLLFMHFYPFMWFGP